MNIDPKQPICGMRPAELKRFLDPICHGSRVTEEWLLSRLKLPKAEAKAKLKELAGAGWIERHERGWLATQQARRLCATKLFARFPAREGRRLAEQFLAEVRVCNASREFTWRVTEVVLFGSVLIANQDELVGDVDLATEIGRRRDIDDAERHRLEDILRQEVPPSANYFQWLCWPERSLHKRLAKVSRKITLHRADEVRQFEYQHRVVYAFDLDAEREIAAEPLPWGIS